MSNGADMLQTIGRIRRSMPRNTGAGSNPAEPAKPRFDKKTYQRDLMRKRRAAEQAKK